MRAMIFVVSDMLEEPRDAMDAVLHPRDRKHEVVLFHLFDPQNSTLPLIAPPASWIRRGLVPSLPNQPSYEKNTCPPERTR